jgi:sugar transferase (PEP-CTERM/EpsH1 system associated)
MRILILTHRLPFAPNRGDRVRAFHIIKLLAARADVHVVSLVHDRAEAAEADTLRALGVRVSTALVPRARNLARAAIELRTNTPLTHVLLDSPGLQPAIDRATANWRPDVVLAYCSGVAPFALVGPLADVPLVLDLVDVDSAKWAAFATSATFPRSWVFRREARCLAAFERRALRAAYGTMVVNERERDTLLRLCPGADVHVVPNGVDVDALAPPAPPTSDERVVFAAVFNYGPNAEGALWFARHVWPIVRAARPSAQLTLAGASPTRAVRRLAESDDSIEATGSVADIRPHLWRSAIAIAPVLQSRGVQNKVLEAAAAGLPSVVTRAVWEGLPTEVLPACRRAENADQFAAEVIGLLSLSPAARRHLASGARLSALAWPQRLATLVDLIDSAAGARLLEPVQELVGRPF